MRRNGRESIRRLRSLRLAERQATDGIAARRKMNRRERHIGPIKNRGQDGRHRDAQRDAAQAALRNCRPFIGLRRRSLPDFGEFGRMRRLGNRCPASRLRRRLPVTLRWFSPIPGQFQQRKPSLSSAIPIRFPRSTRLSSTGALEPVSGEDRSKTSGGSRTVAATIEIYGHAP